MSDLITRPNDATTPMALLQAAIAHNVDTEKLSKLMDLQERWEKNKAKEAYAKAMAACEKEMPAVLKDRENTHTRSQYATLDAVNTAVKPVYAKHGFSVSFNEQPSQKADEIVMIATVRHEAGHVEQFTACIPIDGAGMKGGMNKTGTQAKGSTLTYARRYLMLMIFNIAISDEDTDGNAPQEISDYQIKTIADMIDTIERSGKAFDFGLFLKACHVREGGAIRDILPANYANAVAMLGRKIADKTGASA